MKKALCLNLLGSYIISLLLWQNLFSLPETFVSGRKLFLCQKLFLWQKLAKMCFSDRNLFLWWKLVFWRKLVFWQKFVCDKNVFLWPKLFLWIFFSSSDAESFSVTFACFDDRNLFCVKSPFLGILCVIYREKFPGEMRFSLILDNQDNPYLEPC